MPFSPAMMLPFLFDPESLLQLLMLFQIARMGRDLGALSRGLGNQGFGGGNMGGGSPGGSPSGSPNGWSPNAGARRNPGERRRPDPVRPSGEPSADPPNGNTTATGLDRHLGGAFRGRGQAFIDAAQRHGVDPALLAAIAIHETGNGTSPAVRDRNNPGGLMQPPHYRTLQQFGSLEQGLDAMARNLRRNYLDRGLRSIDQIGRKYAPIGAANDPRGLNRHWVPRVSELHRRLSADTSTAGPAANAPTGVGPGRDTSIPRGLRPNAARGARIVREQFGFRGEIGGIGHRSGPSDHPHGNAIDVMTHGDVTRGNAIAEHFRRNHQELGVKYVIYRQMIASPRTGWQWQPMRDRGSPTANHMDHPHISFY
jgi:hypothetical protein